MFFIHGDCKKDPILSGYNLIANNIFDYEDLEFGRRAPPAIKIFSEQKQNCQDSGFNAVINNQVTGQKIPEPDPGDMDQLLLDRYVLIESAPNLVDGNKIVEKPEIYDKPICTKPYGYPTRGISKYGYGSNHSHVCPVCYMPRGFPRRLLFDGDRMEFVLDEKGFVAPLKRAKLCENALLRETSKVVSKDMEDQKIYKDSFQVKGGHLGNFFCSNKEKIVSARVLCHLGKSRQKFSSMEWNSMKVVGDSKGGCQLISMDFMEEQSNVLTTYLGSVYDLFEIKKPQTIMGVRCERQNSEDCHIEVQYICQKSS